MWPRARLLFALAFVGLVGGLIALRDQGYLGGRLTGGPLRIKASGRAFGGQPNRITAFSLSAELMGGPIRIQNVRPRIVSPELELLGPNVYTGDCGACAPPSWPPSDAGAALEGATLRGPDSQALIGVRAQRSGLYYAIGLVVDYRRGQRRYRDRESQVICVQISRRQRCDPGYRGPRSARVAQVGGPARYPQARVSADAAAYVEPGDYRVRLTLSNQTRSVIDVSELAFDRNRSGVAITATEPETLRLSPHGYQVVRLRLSVPPRCDERFPRLRADLDGRRRSIPLSLPLHFDCAQ